MFSDGMLDLIEAGVITNRQKAYCPNAVVSTFAVGSRRLYDFMHDNSSVLMLRVSDTNDPARIARNSNMCAINSCIEMDLSGQVRFCAECLRFQCMLLGLR
jgi:4-hydroxybutyrate CoA-transferase